MRFQTNGPKEVTSTSSMPEASFSTHDFIVTILLTVLTGLILASGFGVGILTADSLFYNPVKPFGLISEQEDQIKLLEVIVADLGRKKGGVENEIQEVLRQSRDASVNASRASGAE